MKLSEAELAAGLAELPEWEHVEDRLVRSFEFADFSEAWGFLSRVALIAEQLFHHPEWSNVWNKVEIAITNHDAGGLTDLDLEFCRRVDALVGSSLALPLPEVGVSRKDVGKGKARLDP